MCYYNTGPEPEKSALTHLSLCVCGVSLFLENAFPLISGTWYDRVRCGQAAHGLAGLVRVTFVLNIDFFDLIFGLPYTMYSGWMDG